MNVVDGHVTKVLGKRKYISEVDGREIDIYTVEYWDDGGSGQVTELWYNAKDKIEIKPGYIFQH